MDRRIELYLETAYEKLKKGQINLIECEEILCEQKTFNKVGLMSSDEYKIWNQKFQNIYTKKIETIELSTRGRNCLLRANIDTCGKLRGIILNGDREQGIMRLRNLGDKTVHEIIMEALQCQLISRTELIEAPWSPGLLRKIYSWLEAAGL